MTAPHGDMAAVPPSGTQGRPSPAPAPNTSCASTAGLAGSLWPDPTALPRPGSAPNLGLSLGQEGEQGQRGSAGLGRPAHTARCERGQPRRLTGHAPGSPEQDTARGTGHTAAAGTPRPRWHQRLPEPGPAVTRWPRGTASAAAGPTPAAEPRGCEGGRTGLAPRGRGTGPGPLLPSAPAGPAASPARSRRPGAAGHGLCPPGPARPEPGAAQRPRCHRPPPSGVRSGWTTPAVKPPAPTGRVLPAASPGPYRAACPLPSRRRPGPSGGGAASRRGAPGAPAPEPGPAQAGAAGAAGGAACLRRAAVSAAPPATGPHRHTGPARPVPAPLGGAARPGTARQGRRSAGRRRMPSPPPAPPAAAAAPAPPAPRARLPGHLRTPREPGPLSPDPAWEDPPAAGTGHGRGSAQPLSERGTREHLISCPHAPGTAGSRWICGGAGETQPHRPVQPRHRQSGGFLGPAGSSAGLPMTSPRPDGKPLSPATNQPQPWPFPAETPPHQCHQEAQGLPKPCAGRSSCCLRSSPAPGTGRPTAAGTLVLSARAAALGLGGAGAGTERVTGLGSARRRRQPPAAPALPRERRGQLPQGELR
ncbi:collagen alpha-1(I) chain-like [Caloenas nicobarica]|uniref:collagen alpha-1(I) chain-like n=1 Tax=Caloenas nicobarica TaxID=187106 RepID=UPI0032B84532